MLRICSRLGPFFLCLAALVGGPVLAAPGEITGPARVIDGDTLDVGKTRIRLFGIDSVERSQTCRHPVEGDWPCGREVTREVADWLNGETLSCTPRDTDRYGRVVAICHWQGVDVGETLVKAGLAFAYKKYSRRYVTLEAQALAAGRGLWTSVVLRPETFRAQRKAAPQEIANRPSGCVIKGNISSKGARIYHVPGQKYYDKTRIAPHKGERWFCSEAEARRAGWRKART